MKNPALVMVFDDRHRVSVPEGQDPATVFNTWARSNEDKLSARTFCDVPVIDTEKNEVLGFFSMNGRYWTRETMPARCGMQTGEQQWGFNCRHYFNKHLAR